jgi:hypothetical protein
MKISVKFNKNDMGELTATLNLERGTDDPAVISVDGMSRSFSPGTRIEISRLFGRHAGKDAQDWAETAVADIKHQIDEYRTTTPANFDVEY